MKYLKSYLVFESVDLLVSDIDKYKPMVDLMAKFLNLESDENYNLSEMELPVQETYKILHKIQGLFNDRFIKIGNIKYSLSAPGDNELNKLKEIKNIYIGGGESITIDSELYFEDLKFIDWLLYKVEQGDYHVKIDPQYWNYSKPYQLPNNYPNSFDEHVIKNFKSILKLIEDFYHKFKDIEMPSFTFEDIEDMLLFYIDNRIIKKLSVQGRISIYRKISDRLNYAYQINFELILNSFEFHEIKIGNAFESGVLTPELKSFLDNKVSEIYQNCLVKHFMIADFNQFVYRGFSDNEEVSYVTLNLIEK